MNYNIKALIPCCGFGTRMNMKPDESKEMLIYNGFPIIDYTLDLCKAAGLQPVVITRPEKADLIRHLEMNHGRVQVAQYNPLGEWAQTILDNKQYWGYSNILLLPDTRFSPTLPVIKRMIDLLNYDTASIFAIHPVSDPQNWGVIRRKMICEKPTSLIDGGVYDAWGVIGFNKYNGVELFSNMMEKGKWNRLSNYNTIQLDSFQDITRG